MEAKKWHKGGWKSGNRKSSGSSQTPQGKQGDRERLERWLRAKDNSPYENSAGSMRKQPEGLLARICEALKTGDDAALSLIIRESSTIRAICDLHSDYRWAAIRNNCTFRKPDLIGMANGRDEVHKALDEAAAGADTRSAETIGRLGERYNCAILNEALIMAARKGDAEQARKLLGMGADANATGLMGEGPLFAAAAGGYGAGVIRTLLAHGAGMNGDREGALEIARRCRHSGNISALEDGK